MRRPYKIYGVSLAVLLYGVTWTTDIWAYGYLSEYVSASPTEQSDIHDSFSEIKGTDQIMHPRVSTALPMVFRLCTGGNAYSSTFVSEWADQETELVDDVNAALSAWKNAGTGTTLNLGTAIEEAGCGPNTGDYDVENPYSNSGQNRIIFSDYFSPGIIAFASTNLTISDGSLRTSDVDIIFNIWASQTTKIQYQTNENLMNVDPGNTESNPIKFSFLGILTHELGHAFGLSHSAILDDNESDEINTMATMFPAVDGLKESRYLESLETDDTLGIQNLYSPASFPADTGGTLTGNVYFNAGVPARGAHVFVYDVDEERTIAGAFSGMSGTFETPNGQFEIRGIPYNKNFIVYVEPLNRPTVHPNLTYAAFNAPVYYAASLSTDIRSFAVEAYPDVAAVDVHRFADASSDPTFSNAQSFRFTSSNQTRSGIVFYLNTSYTAPNDAVGTSFAINNEEVISDVNPLTVTLSIPTDLSIFEGPEVSLTATRSDGTTYDWTSGLGAFTFSGISSSVQVDATHISTPNGDYTLSLSLADSKYLDVNGDNFKSIQGAFDGQIEISVRGWNGANSGGGGGCQLEPHAAKENALLLTFMLFALALMTNRFLNTSRETLS